MTALFFHQVGRFVMNHSCLLWLTCRLSKDLRSWKCCMACQISVNICSHCTSANTSSSLYVLVSGVTMLF